MASPNTGVITQTLSRSSYTTTAKEIDGRFAGGYESYDKNPIWDSAVDSPKFSIAMTMRWEGDPNQSYPMIWTNGALSLNGEQWYDGGAKFFYIYLYDQNFYGWECDTVGISTHGIDIDEWFTIFISIDYSAAGVPTPHVWLQKTGESTAINAVDVVGDNDVGPKDLDFANTSVSSFASHQWYNQQSSHISISEVFMTDEYVDWSDSAERAKYLDANGRPVGLGADGSTITGTAAKIYAPDGDLSNNQGTGGDYTEVGTIDDASTSPSDGAGSGGPWFSQAGTGTFGAGTSTASAAQTLPFITQAAKDSFSAVGAQTLPVPTQAGTATFEPGTSTGVVAQSTPLITQAITAEFFAGTNKGPIEQSLWPITQTLIGTYGAGTSSGVITQTINGIVSTISGTHQRGHYAVGEQGVPFLTCTLTATNTPSNRTADGAQALPILTQSAFAIYDKGASTGWITNQMPPFISQALTGEIYETGVITQPLPIVTQILVGEFSAGASTGVIGLTLPLVGQALTGSRERTGDITQILPPRTQSLVGSFAPGVSTGSMDFMLPSVAQSATAQFFAGTSTGVITSILPFINQTARAVTYKIRTPTIRLVWEQPVDELIWEPQEDELIWER